MELLNKIQRELKVPKGQFNAFAKYHYRNCEDILEAVKPLLGKGVLTLSDEIEEIAGRVYVKATATLTAPNEDILQEVQGGQLTGVTTIKPITQAVYVTAYAREALDKKGMDEAQITGAASSYARKYALCGLFCIDDGKDADGDDNTQEKPAAKPVPPKKVVDKRDALKKRIADLCNDISLVPLITAEDYQTYVKENTGMELVEEHYEAIVDALEAIKQFNGKIE